MCDKCIMLNIECSITLFAKYMCHGKDGAESLKKSPVSIVPCTGTLCRLVVDKYRIRGSVLDS